MLRGAVQLLLSALLWLAPLAAPAQRGFDLQTFQPPAGRTAGFALEEPEALPHLSMVPGFGVSYGRELLLRDGDDPSLSVATDQLQFEASFALALFGALELGMVMPLVMLRAADNISLPSAIEPRWAPGDLRLSWKASLLTGDTALALVLLTTLPTGDDGNMMGESAWTLVPAVVGSQRLGRLRLVLRLAYRMRHPVDAGPFVLDDEFDWRLAAEVTALPWLQPILESGMRISIRSTRTPLLTWEALAGVRFAPARCWSVDLGVGTGLPPGRDGYGVPDLRVLTGLRHTIGAQACADRGQADRDGDGLLDAQDLCPAHAEDRDGFQDEDGCPDPDNDADGVPDVRDGCPAQGEDRDGYHDRDGCPEPDNDGDGLADAADRCPMQPEDGDGFQDEDGCPEPGPRALTVTVTDTRIMVSERIFFEYGQEQIRPISAPVLDRLAQVIQSLPSGHRVRVEGHSDNAGDEAHNSDLSFRRAAAVVRALLRRGVPDNRLEFRGHGSARPVAPNDTPEGRALNRRVEFVMGRSR